MSLILVTGATGRHGGTGAYVARRLRQEGHQVRVLVRTQDERSAAFEADGFDVRLGDLRDRSTLLPAMEGVEQASFCFPVDSGIVEAAANFISALRKVSPDARVVVMSMMASQESSPSHLGRAAWLAEEIMASAGAKVCVLRVAALFYENLLVLHRDSIRAQGVIRNCFGDTRMPWISGEDAAELMVAALLHPERFGGQSVCYPRGDVVLSHKQIAEILSVELGREINYESVSADQWRKELVDLSQGGHPVVNEDMAKHIAALGVAFAARSAEQTAIAPGSVATLIGRDALQFREFVQRAREQLDVSI
jgi:uncharacterized protein YbjT (DUF2867 family)